MESAPGRFLYITAKNIKDYGVDLSDVRYIDEDIHQSIYARCNPEQGDLLLTKDGAKTGEIAVNQLHEEFSLLSSAALLKPKRDLLAQADVLVCGHTHIPYHRILPRGRHVVNAGSVGKPKDGNPQACYVLLELNDRNLTVNFKRVPYDVERAAQAIEVSSMPDEYAEMLRIGKG